MAESATQRLVPGAPPPAPLTKSQLKKKRKTKKIDSSDELPVAIPDATGATLTEQAPQPADVENGTVAPELVVQDVPPAPPAPPSESDNSSLKLSPIVDLITKRLKATNKKITRISGYASTDPEKLNDDQKRTLKTLPTLEAVAKELSEVKKAVETHEAELALELRQKQAEIDKAAQLKISEAVAAQEDASRAKTYNLLSLLRFRNLLSSGQVESTDATLANIVFSLYDVLLGPDGDAKHAANNGISTGEGDFESVPYSRIWEFLRECLAPRAATTVPETEPEPTPEEDTATSYSGTEEAPVSDLPLTTSSSFHFMQASELETPVEESTEWVSVDTPAPARPVMNGHTETEAVRSVDTQASMPIDWADQDDDTLPSLNEIHASFNTSGAATPVVGSNGDTHTPVSAELEQPVDDGFVQAKRGGRGHRGGYRGRGEGRGRFRGDGDRGRTRGRGGRGRRGGDRPAPPS